MKPAALVAYDQHDAIMADLIRAARTVSLLPLDLVNETLAKMMLTGRYHRPGGKTVLIPSNVADLHAQVVDTARAFVEAVRELTTDATALNPSEA